MTVAIPHVLIQTRHPRARRDYICHNCGGIISKGTYHDESVVRIGSAKYRDPIEHQRTHSDCKAPWWQPWSPPRLTRLGALPSHASERATAASAAASAVMVTVHHPHFGLIEWELPPTLHARMLQSRRTDTEAAVTSQVRDVLSLVATALVDVAGDRRRATRLSHVLNELIYVSRDVTPPKKRKRKCDH